MGTTCCCSILWRYSSRKRYITSHLAHIVPYLTEHGADSSLVHLYFLNSPFCDPSSNNAVLNLQAGRNQALFPILQDRKLFEERLSTLRGVEYVIVDGPNQNFEGMNPIWIIRKRNRERGGPGEPDELTTLGTYYCVGSRIYQAPSLADIIASKLVGGLTVDKYHPS